MGAFLNFDEDVTQLSRFPAEVKEETYICLQEKKKKGPFA